MKNYQTLKVDCKQDRYYIQIHRPDADNTINTVLIQEMTDVLNHCEQAAKVVVIQGSPDVFCMGADFNEARQHPGQTSSIAQLSGLLYEIWLRLNQGPFISVAYVEGKVNAGGVGFVSACDIVFSHETVTFSLSELLFGLFPACVLPFLCRRIGQSRAHYMSCSTQTITATQAHGWGLVDVLCPIGDLPDTLRKHLLRISCIEKKSIIAYKAYMSQLYPHLQESQALAAQANQRMFSDEANIKKIEAYLQAGG